MAEVAPQTKRSETICFQERNSVVPPTTKLLAYIKSEVTKKPRIEPNSITVKKIPMRDRIVFILCIEYHEQTTNTTKKKDSETVRVSF